MKTLPDINAAKAEALKVLQETLGNAGEFLANEWVGRSTGTPSDPGYDLKQHFKISKGQGRGHSWWIHAVIKTKVHPSHASQAIWRLKKNPPATTKGEGIYPLLIAPHISESVAAMCEEEKIGWLDLSGNCNLEFGGLWIDRQGKERKYKEEQSQRSLFSPKASRLLRVLLQGPLRSYKVEELAATAGVSLGLVSKVRKLLLEIEAAKEDQSGFRITEPNEILDEWTREDDWKKRTETQEYSLLENDQKRITGKLEEILGAQKFAYTGLYGAYLRKPYALPDVTTLYVENFPDDDLLKSTLYARRVDRGGGLRLVKPKDDGVLFPLQELKGKKVVCDVQLYLDVIQAGGRGVDAAEILREARDFSGGWK